MKLVAETNLILAIVLQGVHDLGLVTVLDEKDELTFQPHKYRIKDPIREDAFEYFFGNNAKAFEFHAKILNLNATKFKAALNSYLVKSRSVH